jgi:hypothetical protein
MDPMILAHQGGWDEALVVFAPLVVIGGLLLLANRRANAHQAEPDVTGAAKGDDAER